MQLLHENKTLLVMKEINMSASIAIKNVSSSNLDVKEKRSSNTSLLHMNPVASGDNVATGLNSAHRLKEEMPSLVPCCEGKELQVLPSAQMMTGITSGVMLGKSTATPLAIRTNLASVVVFILAAFIGVGEETLSGVTANIFLYGTEVAGAVIPNYYAISEDLVRSGLSAISVKHDSVVQCLSMSRACERMQVPPGLVKHRNSFRSLHRPDLKRVPYLRRMTPDELETLFRGYADIPTRGHYVMGNDNREEVTKMTLPPDESSRLKIVKKEVNYEDADGTSANALQAIPETRSGAEDVPEGMRLHGARARLYTSVLAGAKAGDQLDDISTNEEFDTRVSEDIPEDEVQLHEELQIILPPRCDDVTADSSITTTSIDTYS